MKPTTRTLLPLAGAALAYSLAQTMVIPALPELQAEFHANPADATWLLTAFLLTSSVATPLLGRLGDMHGKERWLLISLAIFGVGSLIAALGGSLAVLITGRAVQGAGGAIFPLAIGIIRDEFPRERVAPAIGTVSAMFGIGGGTGLVLAGLFVDHGSISWIFWLSVVTTALAALATWLWVPESPVRVRARIDWVGGVLLSLTLHRAAAADQRGQHVGLDLGRASSASSRRRRSSPWCGRAGSCASTTRSSNLELMRERPVWTTNVAGCAIGFAMFGSFVLDPAVRADAVLGRLRLRRHGDRVGALPAPVGPAHALRRAVQRAPGRALRLARAARARRAVLRAELRLAGGLPRRAHRHLPRERPARARGRDGAGGDGQPRRRGRAART